MGSKSKFHERLSEDKIISGFEKLRQEQRCLYSKLTTTEEMFNEHKLVANILRDSKDDIKCFRLLEGVLVESTVKDVYPKLLMEKEKLGNEVDEINKKIKAKANELNEYQAKYNIKVRAEPFQDS